MGCRLEEVIGQIRDEAFFYLFTKNCNIFFLTVIEKNCYVGVVNLFAIPTTTKNSIYIHDNIVTILY